METEIIVKAILDAYYDDEIDQDEINEACVKRLKKICEGRGAEGKLAAKLIKATAELLEIYA